MNTRNLGARRGRDRRADPASYAARRLVGFVVVAGALLGLLMAAGVSALVDLNTDITVLLTVALAGVAAAVAGALASRVLMGMRTAASTVAARRDWSGQLGRDREQAVSRQTGART